MEKTKLLDPMVEKQRINQFKLLRHGNVIAKMDAEIDLMMYSLNQARAKQGGHHQTLIQASSKGNLGHENVGFSPLKLMPMKPTSFMGGNQDGDQRMEKRVPKSDGDNSVAGKSISSLIMPSMEAYIRDHI